MAFVGGWSGAVRQVGGLKKRVSVGFRRGSVVCVSDGPRHVLGKVDRRDEVQMVTKGLIVAAADLVDRAVCRGTQDFSSVRNEIVTLMESELHRAVISAETLRASLCSLAESNGPLSPVNQQKAFSLFASLVLMFSALQGLPSEAMAAPDAAPSAVMMAPEESSSTVSRQLSANGIQNWRYSEFYNAVVNNKVEKVTFSADGSRVLAVDIEGNRFKLDALPNDPELLQTLTEHKVDVTVLPTVEDNGLSGLLQSLIFPAILFGGLFLITRRAGGGGPGGPFNPMDLGRSGARVAMVPETGVTFEDVAGVEGAKLELQEVVQFLKESERFTKLGARIPRGVILEGPPGTGKTLIARAVAGEAGVPFFSISGSEFVEMFVGVGASRVRDLFEQAKKNAPCIIFIDEIDAVGRQRGAGFAGGNDEREQTLNQLLVEMDGFEGNPGIIVIAATNRSDVLDNALLRPGRFDRRVVVDLPDFGGRAAILRVHAKGKPFEPSVDLDMIARRTPGFSGASLKNLLNEAAIFTARRGKKEISMDEIDDAIERVTVGAQKKDPTMTQQKKELVAFHEAGHAIVGALTPDYDQVAKITIIPRGGAGGLTFFAPNEARVDSGMYSKQFLEAQLAVALGGRVAEEIIFGEDEITTGASNDFQQVTRVARQMITRFGMSKKVGQLVLERDGGSPFLGRQMASQSLPISSSTKDKIDEEVTRLVKTSYERAKDILTSNRDLLDKIASILVDKETISADEFQRILAEHRKVKMIPYATL
eukprot:CAMPEP_0184688662 /NCGR_PEP_ID=MMETSP0312-20130426/30222_1 /TAXON_ID=31354 /ORGANISM="Compsopogon coeruleus, Strain SAG 36.94" /LENGTH=762 /DNA_ID=CAMNT_0027145921 /DNA_START=2739 /DNA_END=5027 /DNA_ORIENTATION=-